ncbi:ABC transporter substrate binding protein [Bradyrhizobium sp. AZCC 1693]|uniref:ABC transporter substrate binding protein n=1 Tax=Bradyrhizobium sp. AZCC 1693 TaxID=3117029 RepID=UPI002FEEAEBB
MAFDDVVARDAAGKVRRIGLIAGGSRTISFPIVAAFPRVCASWATSKAKISSHGVALAEGSYGRIPGFAAELVQSRVDVFVLATGAAIRPVQQATSTIPIVMAYSIDPVGNGFVASLARPGGNTTRLAGSADDTSPKQIELAHHYSKTALHRISRKYRQSKLVRRPYECRGSGPDRRPRHRACGSAQLAGN